MPGGYLLWKIALKGYYVGIYSKALRKWDIMSGQYKWGIMSGQYLLWSNT